jgi:ketosteroid isomerase-like protein
MMAHYWNSPQLFTVGQSGGVTQGWDQARAFQERFFNVASDIAVDQGEWHQAGGDSDVLSSCPCSLTITTQDGSQQHLEGWYINFRQQFDGRWLVVYEYVTGNAQFS